VPRTFLPGFKAFNPRDPHDFSEKYDTGMDPGIVAWYEEFRALFPDARISVYVPLRAAWWSVQIARRWSLDQYLETIYRVGTIFDDFVDFSVPSEATEDFSSTYDGVHYLPEANQIVVEALNVELLLEPLDPLRLRCRLSLFLAVGVLHGASLFEDPFDHLLLLPRSIDPPADPTERESRHQCHEQQGLETDAEQTADARQSDVLSLIGCGAREVERL